MNELIAISIGISLAVVMVIVFRFLGKFEPVKKVKGRYRFFYDCVFLVCVVGVSTFFASQILRLISVGS